MRAKPWLTIALTLGLGLAAESCLTRTIPLPPPGGTINSESCESATPCPDGGKIVTIRGQARDGALVVAENVSRNRSDGMHFVATTTATTADDVAAGRSSQAGAYEVCLCPRSDGAGGVLVSRSGDQISVYMIVDSPDGIERSMPLMLTVP